MIADFKQLAPVALVNATGGLAGVSVAEFHGRAKIVVSHTATGAAGETIDLKLQHRNGSDAWADVPGATFAQITNGGGAGIKVIEVNADGLKGEVRLHATCNTNADATLGAVVVGRTQY